MRCCLPVFANQHISRHSCSLSSCGYSQHVCLKISPQSQHHEQFFEEAFTHAEAVAAADSSAASKDGLMVHNEVQMQQETSRPTFLDTRRLSHIRRRRSSTNGYAALSILMSDSQAQILPRSSSLSVGWSLVGRSMPLQCCPASVHCSGMSITACSWLSILQNANSLHGRCMRCLSIVPLANTSIAILLSASYSQCQHAAYSEAHVQFAQ